MKSLRFAYHRQPRAQRNPALKVVQSGHLSYNRCDYQNEGLVKGTNDEQKNNEKGSKAQPKEALLDIIDSNIPIVYNLNVGHATPRAIVPFGVHAHVDATEQVIRFDYNK